MGAVLCVGVGAGVGGTGVVLVVVGGASVIVYDWDVSQTLTRAEFWATVFWKFIKIIKELIVWEPFQGNCDRFQIVFIFNRLINGLCLYAVRRHECLRLFGHVCQNVGSVILLSDYSSECKSKCVIII